MAEYKLPKDTGNRLIDALIKAIEICDGYTGFTAYGPCLTSRLPNGVHLNFTVDPYIYYDSDIPNPEEVENFTVRFVAYTRIETEEGGMAHFLSSEEIDNLLKPEDEAMMRICAGVKEMNGLELTLSKEEYREAENAIVELERLEFMDEAECLEEADLDRPDMEL